ncbi:protein of unknown function [Moritella yayanosii]|uniref:Uncharacterized protein n=1 Tax=Moritella yayanosii TaxID=69539 RepID=A0A330LPF8_9GAMM|nr:protein of unknown function [Moritella yayanosii]
MSRRGYAVTIVIRTCLPTYYMDKINRQFIPQLIYLQHKNTYCSLLHIIENIKKATHLSRYNSLLIVSILTE